MDLTKRFEGRTALITGAGSGIGAATARRLAAEGARVLVTDVDEESARTVAADLPNATAHRLDITDRQSVDEVIGGLPALHVLVNNAFVPFVDDPDDNWHRQLHGTLLGAVHCSRAALPHLAATGGAVVTIGSVNAEADFGDHAYSAAKAALGSYTRTLAGEAAPHGVRVNQINPGTVATPSWAGREQALAALGARAYPLGRVGTPDDIAAAVAFLASPDAAWITGTTLRVDGGLMAVNRHFREILDEVEEEDA
ncbi:SDR family NAD(P)-dependent oxidoreductase [Streptomyces filamentosus]|uniref:SDR family NAD(P)-dependent oxidoreductase n=1 Tax=Streptomyces filamentosus TaxID=67294 RepID=UPI00123AF9B5|nr:SDR family NAD(P)-dependent oxidoreductase [Streptomyces filamentosus]KAA6218079.1 SDR family oxidoreductase [Streptomyces filamentosus]